jgi:hypothetical protein
MGVGITCAVHCALTPFLLILVPALGAGMLGNRWFEFSLLAFVLVLGGSSILHGYRHHRRAVPPVLFILAFIGFCMEPFYPWRESVWILRLLTSAGLVASLLWSRMPDRPVAGERQQVPERST